MVTICALTRAEECMREICGGGYAGGRNARARVASVRSFRNCR